MALTRTAKSCGSDAPMLASSLREEAQATVSNKPGHRGEHEGNRKTIARGMPGDFRCDRGDYARVLCFIFAREASGALGARHSLRPLFLGERFLQKLGQIAPRECGSVSQIGVSEIDLVVENLIGILHSTRHCEERSDEAIQSGS